MKKNGSFKKKALKKNGLYAKLLLVILAFALMAASSSIFVSNMLHNHLIKEARDMLAQAKLKVETDLIVAETMLDNHSENIRGMIIRGGDENEVGDYLRELSGIMKSDRKLSKLNYNNVFGYFDVFRDDNGELGRYISGEYKNLPDDYDATKRPWYEAAKQADGAISVLPIYKMVDPDEYVMSYSRCIFDDVGGPLFTLGLNITLDSMSKYVSEMKLTKNSYGFLESENSDIMAHPYPEYIGKNMREVNADLFAFSNEVRAGADLTEHIATNYQNLKVVVFTSRLENNWVLSIAIPRSEYYRELSQMAFIISAFGAILAAVLIFILIRMDKATKKADGIAYEANQAAAELRLSRAAAESANQAKSRFLATISHEIRTPMNAILGIAEILLRDETLTAEMKEALNKIYNSGDLLLRIINDILDLSKIDAGKLELNPQRYETASLINDTVTLNMMRIGSKPIEFLLSVDENVPAALIGDDLRIKQILNNLLSNAFKYSAKGTVKLSVFAENADGKLTLVFCVSDTGQGMTEEQVAKLFDEYARFNAEANRMTEGTGLGMSITKKLADMMNGSISVESEVNKGTIFTVRLPQDGTDSKILGKAVAESLQKLNFDYANQFKKTQIVYELMPYGRVLIVDDVESNLYVARGLLAPYGLSITTVTNGFDAINQIKDGNVYDIVFMDHMMPVMDGIETTGKIRGLGYKHTIVALTANAVIGQADVFLAAGFDDFISKPMDTRRLAAVLKKYIRDKQPPEVIEATHKLVLTLNERRAKETQPPVEKPSADPQLIEFFIKDASKTINVLESIHKKHGDYNDEDIRMFTTAVHAMKSALGNIGETALSAFAARLEQSGRNKDKSALLLETPPFLTELRSKIAKLSLIKMPGEEKKPVKANYAYLHEKLLALKKACGAYDRKAEKAVISELREKDWPQAIKESLDTINELLLGGDVEETINLADKIIQSL